MGNIVLIGPPGGGKGTQAEKLIQHYNLAHIVPGNLMREHIRKKTHIGNKISSYLNEGILAPHEIVMDLVEEQIKNNKHSFKFLFDGFPRALPQATFLDELLPKHGHQIDRVIFLDVPDEIVKQRIKERAKILGRSDDQSEDKVATRLEVYYKETLPVVEFYEKQNKVYRVKGLDSVEEVFARINKILQPLYKK